MNLKLTSCALAAALVMAFSSIATARPGGGVEPIGTVRVASGLNYPVYVTHAPGDYKRLFIVEKRGVIRILNLRTGVINAASFLDINSLVGGGTTLSDERGLLGLAFHPNYQANGYFYVYYTDNSSDTVVARYSRTAGNPDDGNENSALTILTLDQPFANHNGGWLGFGPFDGYLYISFGDGGSQGDPNGHGQNTDTWLGSILRVDVNGDAFPKDDDANYAVPVTNPFVKGGGAPEVYVYGFRNPWRCGFDSETGALYIGDVGQGDWEEVSYVAIPDDAGKNYGWRCYEGDHAYSTGGCAPIGTMTFPIQEFSHGGGRIAVSGGFVYRGCAIPSMRGTYFCADYGSAQIWSLNYDGTNLSNFTERTAELAPGGGLSLTRVSAFGSDAYGEMYIVKQSSSTTSEVYKIIPDTPTISVSDFNCDGAVNVLDLLQMLGGWGPCESCKFDLNFDGTVNVLDLLQLLADWG